MAQVKSILIAALIFNLVLPAPVFAAVGSAPSVTILPVVSDKASVEGQFAMELAYALSRDLGTSVNMIAPDVLNQSNKTLNITELSGEYLELYKKFAAARNKYTLGGQAGQAIEGLEMLAGEILKNVEFNREFSKLYESIQLSKALIYFQDQKTEKASQTIRDILAVKSSHTIDSLGYPGNFRKFLTRETKKQGSDTAILKIVSRPSAVDVFVNGIYSGNSSNPITVPSGALQLSFATGGRKTVHKQLTISAGENRVVRAALAWKNDKNKTTLSSYSGDQFEQLSLSSAVNQGIHADKVVFLGVQHDLKGYQVFAKVYDQKFHQPLATIKYPKIVQNIRTESSKLKEYISAKIRPHLSNPANHLWKGDYDTQIRLDDRIALRPREPLYRKPGFWAAVGTVVIGGTILGIALSQGGSSSSGGDGSVVVDLGGFQGVRK